MNVRGGFAKAGRRLAVLWFGRPPATSPDARWRWRCEPIVAFGAGCLTHAVGGGWWTMFAIAGVAFVVLGWRLEDPT